MALHSHRKRRTYKSPHVKTHSHCYLLQMPHHLAQHSGEGYQSATQQLTLSLTKKRSCRQSSPCCTAAVEASKQQSSGDGWWHRQTKTSNPLLIWSLGSLDCFLLPPPLLFLLFSVFVFFFFCFCFFLRFFFSFFFSFSFSFPFFFLYIYCISSSSFFLLFILCLHHSPHFGLFPGMSLLGSMLETCPQRNRHW